MSEKYDLEKMLKELDEDRANLNPTNKNQRLSQKDIKALLKKKKKDFNK